MIDDSQLEPSDEISVEPSDEAIRLRSQQIWEREGCPEGCAQDHWLRAKTELDAEQEHWERVKAELEAEMERTSTMRLAAPLRRKGDFVRPLVVQARVLMRKAWRAMARFMELLARWAGWYGRIEKNPGGLSTGDVAFAHGSNEAASAGSHLPLLAAARRSKQTIAAPSIICADIVLHGTLESTGDIQLDGRVEGDVRSACVVVGDQAVIQGEVVADEVTVRGCIRGSIRARKILLRSGARVEGDILYGIFVAEAGAQFEGNCRHLDDPLSQENAPEEPADVPSEDVPRSQTAA